MVKFIQRDEKLFEIDEILFKWMKICRIEHYNLAPTVFGVPAHTKPLIMM
jgi:hypothetical protein